MNNAILLHLKPAYQPIAIRVEIGYMPADSIQGSKTEQPGYKRSGRNTDSCIPADFINDGIRMICEQVPREVAALIQ